MLLIHAAAVSRDVIVSFTLPLFPELAPSVFMPQPVVVTLDILGAHRLARRIVRVFLIANARDGSAGAPICRPDELVHDCIP